MNFTELKLAFSAKVNLCKQPPKVFCKKKVVLSNFAKFTGKHLFKRLFFNKVGGLRTASKSAISPLLNGPYVIRSSENSNHDSEPYLVSQKFRIKNL